VLVELQLEGCWVAIHLIKIIKNTCLELQLKCLRSCNWSDDVLQLECLRSCNRSALKSCNWSVCRVATVLPLQLQSDSGSSCNRCTLRVANTKCFPPDTALPLQLQPDSGSSCNRCTLWVANTEYFRLILYYTFSCNPTVVRVAIIFV
jgi:hypothetical protein